MLAPSLDNRQECGRRAAITKAAEGPANPGKSMEIPSGILPFATKIQTGDGEAKHLVEEEAERVALEWGKVCRICACTGSHEIFAKIPIYLHGNYNEYLSWQKPISQLIEETTGLRVSPPLIGMDGGPRRAFIPAIECGSPIAGFAG